MGPEFQRFRALFLITLVERKHPRESTVEPPFQRRNHKHSPHIRIINQLFLFRFSKENVLRLMTIIFLENLNLPESLPHHVESLKLKCPLKLMPMVFFKYQPKIREQVKQRRLQLLQKKDVYLRTK